MSAPPRTEHTTCGVSQLMFDDLEGACNLLEQAFGMLAVMEQAAGAEKEGLKVLNPKLVVAALDGVQQLIAEAHYLVKVEVLR